MNGEDDNLNKFNNGMVPDVNDIGLHSGGVASPNDSPNSSSNIGEIIRPQQATATSPTAAGISDQLLPTQPAQNNYYPQNIASNSSPLQPQAAQPGTTLPPTVQSNVSSNGASYQSQQSPRPSTGSSTYNQSTAGNIYGSSQTANPNIASNQVLQQPKRGRKSKLIVLAVLSLFFLLGGSAGAYYGLIVPNKPENVWKKSMSNMSNGLDKLVEHQSQSDGDSTTKFTGDYKMNIPELNFSGNYAIEMDSKSSTANVALDIEGAKLTLDAMSELKEASKFPDFYLRIQGLASLSAPLGGQTDMFDGLDNQWFVLDGQTIGEMVPGDAIDQPADKAESLTQQDYDELAGLMSDSIKEYVFTSDETISIFNEKEFIAKETVDDRQQFHYRVSLDKANLKKFAKDFITGAESSSAYKKLFGEATESSTLDDANDYIDQLHTVNKLDIWIDAKTKLIRTVRITNPTDSNHYMDFGLKYEGGKKFPLYVKVVDETEGSKAVLDTTSIIDTETDTVSMTFDYRAEGEEQMELSLTGNITKTDTPVSFDDRPENATPLLDMLFSSNLITGSGQSGYLDQPSLTEEGYRYELGGEADSYDLYTPLTGLDDTQAVNGISTMPGIGRPTETPVVDSDVIAGDLNRINLLGLFESLKQLILR